MSAGERAIRSRAESLLFAQQELLAGLDSSAVSDDREFRVRVEASVTVLEAVLGIEPSLPEPVPAWPVAAG